MLGGGGSNILRGGKRTYDCSTLVGNFVEEAYRPGALGGVRDGGEMYATNTRVQMLEGAGIVTKPFGAGLKRPEDPKYDYKEIVGPDKTRGASTWISLSHSTHCNSSKASRASMVAGRDASPDNETLWEQPTEFAAPRELKGRRMPDDELDKHRERWTHESDPEVLKARFATETSAMMDPVVRPDFRKELCKPTPSSFK